VLEVDGNAESAVCILDGVEGLRTRYLEESQRVASDEGGVLAVENAFVEHRRRLNDVGSSLDLDVDAVHRGSDGTLGEGGSGGKPDAQ
jgi:hypothetical protein